ncbi:unnamed protein product [Amoebophrya sp. A25]|nr:unnamed protein product [Amoebophrya sp. A25]|eukprot:GSA25T00026966001.1
MILSPRSLQVTEESMSCRLRAYVADPFCALKRRCSRKVGRSIVGSLRRSSFQPENSRSCTRGVDRMDGSAPYRWLILVAILQCMPLFRDHLQWRWRHGTDCRTEDIRGEDIASSIIRIDGSQQERCSVSSRSCSTKKSSPKTGDEFPSIEAVLSSHDQPQQSESDNVSRLLSSNQETTSCEAETTQQEECRRTPSVARPSTGGGIIFAAAQRQRRPDEGLPPGLERWIGRDECSEENGWVAFYHTFARGIQQAQSGAVISQPLREELQKGTLPERNAALFSSEDSAIGILRNLTDGLLQEPEKAFQCGTAMSSVFSMLSTLYDSVNMPVLALRAVQHASIFGSFDYQMKGEDYIDQSPWPITWKESIEQSLKRMDRVQKLQRSENWRRTKLGRRPGARKLKILIVSVCEYNNDVTPLYSLSFWNKKRYADKHDYEVIVHEKGPLLQDQFKDLFTEPPSHRPPAWSKIDAVLMGLRQGHDWVMWMDCDSYFMDQEFGIHELIDSVLEREAQEMPGQTEGVKRPFADPPLEEFLKKWDAAPGTLEAFDTMLSSPKSDSSAVLDQTQIGWDDWLVHPTYEKDGKKRIELIVSEDGLMLNTGIFFVRSSVWAWRFFQKVRRFTFGNRAPITQHPWWEQTAMVYLIQMPFANEKNWAVAPAVSLLDQRHINPYPHLVSSALLTHVAFEPDDYIISFSGCKIYSSQDVCNALFFNYFAISVPDYASIKDDTLQAWLEKGKQKYR